MTKTEISKALEIATSDESLLDTDHSVLFGLYLPQFKQVHTTVKVVARMVRELAVMFNGQVDAEALNEFAANARQKIMIV